jgi:hypothetical protein
MRFPEPFSSNDSWPGQQNLEKDGQNYVANGVPKLLRRCRRVMSNHSGGKYPGRQTAISDTLPVFRPKSPVPIKCNRTDHPAEYAIQFGVNAVSRKDR